LDGIDIQQIGTSRGHVWEQVENDPLASDWNRPLAEAGRAISVEDWAEIRPLHRAEGVPIREIARRLGIARNTIRAALRADHVPR
jgi:hypothetical protein